MAIEKLTEFAKTGQKDTDQLDLEVGFIVNRKPARQWFNWLFNTLTTKINEIIDADFVPKSEIIDDLTTNDAKKPASAKQVKLLQDNKLDANKRGAVSGVASLDENKKVLVAELPTATSSAAGVMKLINDLTIGGIDAALAAEQGKLLLLMFAGGVNHFRIPNIAEPTKPWIVQFGNLSLPNYTNPHTFQHTNFTFPITFPNELSAIAGVSTNGIVQNGFTNHSIEHGSKLGATVVFSAATSMTNPRFSYIAIGK